MVKPSTGYWVYPIYGLMEWTMEWTDGMEYQLIKIAKTHRCGRGEVVSAVLPLLASTGLLCLASAF